jgi:LacI family transcriptional regulator
MRGSSYTIGVMVTELSAPFQVEVAQGIADELEAGPFQEVIIAGSAVPQRQRRGIEALVDRQVDGLVVVAPWMSAQWLDELGARIPVVAVARHGGGATFDTVVDDDYDGARLMVDYLAGLGHVRITHTSMTSGGLSGPSVGSPTARCDGYVAAMRRRGLEADVIETAYDEEGGYRAAREALARPVPPTAVFAGADIAALGVLRAAEERGLEVPRDLSVTGYDNIYISTIGRVSLTTVDQSGHLTGSVSARLLLERISGRTRPVHYVIAPRLVARGTSAAPRALEQRTAPPKRVAELLPTSPRGCS